MQENLKFPGVLSEVDLLEVLNIEKPTLDNLRRQNDFPFVRLNLNNRVYLIEDVTAWLKSHRRNAGTND